MYRVLWYGLERTVEANSPEDAAEKCAKHWASAQGEQYSFCLTVDGEPYVAEARLEFSARRE